MADILPITVNGKKKLEEELKRLLREDRPNSIRAIEEARGHGDISENAEYDAAKERQAHLESRIIDIQNQLAGAEIVDPASIQSERIVFGAHVVLEDTETEEQFSYQIVGIDEADVKDGKISILSPMARALIGKSASDVIEVRSPKGQREYEIKKFFFR